MSGLPLPARGPDWFDAIPKVELHVHREGAIPLPALFELVRKYDSGAAGSLAELEARLLGKRVCIGVEGDLWLVLHLMIAGRLHWYEGKAKRPASRTLAWFEFSNGILTLTEAGSQRRASLSRWPASTSSPRAAKR